MGREIRNVIPGWEHPRDERTGEFIPLYDNDYETEAQEWIKNFVAWEIEHTDPDYVKHPEYHYWDWDGGPPDPQSYRKEKWTPEQATWVQMYETVSEGTPVSPAFATRKELIDYLVEHGDYWDQNRGDGGWDRNNAEKFVNRGWAPSMMVMHTETTNTIFMPRDGLPE